jgi:hypothetical protein
VNEVTKAVLGNSRSKSGGLLSGVLRGVLGGLMRR